MDKKRLARRILKSNYMRPDSPPPEAFKRLTALLADVRALCEIVLDGGDGK